MSLEFILSILSISKSNIKAIHSVNKLLIFLVLIKFKLINNFIGKNPGAATEYNISYHSLSVPESYKVISQNIPLGLGDKIFLEKSDLTCKIILFKIKFKY